MDVQHVTLLHTLRIFQDKKHLCSSQLHLKHYCTIHFSCALTNNTALFQSISFFFGTEVGVESWSRVKSSLYFHSVGSAVRPRRLLSCSGGSADFLHRHFWLTCHTLCSWVPVSWHCSFPPLTVTTPHPPTPLRRKFSESNRTFAHGTVGQHRPSLKSKRWHLEGWLTEPTVQRLSVERAAELRFNPCRRYVSINVFVHSPKNTAGSMWKCQWCQINLFIANNPLWIPNK